MISSFKLPFNVDPELLQSDLNQIGPDEWVAHFNRDYFEGEWTGGGLRSFGGDSRQLYPQTKAPEEERNGNQCNSRRRG